MTSNSLVTADPGADSGGSPKEGNPVAEVAAAPRADVVNRSALKARMMASAFHLVISTAVAALAFALVFFVWFPGRYWAMAGGQGLFFLVAGVDVVLGPIMTLAIFNPAKKRRSLIFDLIVVGVLQLAALCYGLLNIAAARPLFMVYSVGQLSLVRNADLSREDLAKAENPQFRHAPWNGPRLIGTRRATSAERMALIDSALAGRDVDMQPKFYIPYQDAITPVLSHGKDIATLKLRNKGKEGEIDARVKKLGRDANTLLFLPTIARGDWVAILDANSAQIVDYWPLNGF